MKGIVIFGAGQAGMALYRLLQRRGNRVVAFGDNKEELWDRRREGLPIWPFERVLEADPEEIWLAIVNEDAQRELKARFRARGYGGRLFGLSDLRERFQLRLAACRLLAQEIRRRGVAGDVAELGVYQGEFAEELNRLFPERRLYLFDTFSGFDERDIGSADGARAKAGQFSDTSAEAVLARMETPGQVVIKKGLFPESLGEMAAERFDGRFALVSLDVDLYRPTMAGLTYFYPRLSPGGYLILDDYNSPQFPGAGQAIREFCDREGLGVVPLPDLHGTAVLVKTGKTGGRR